MMTVRRTMVLVLVWVGTGDGACHQAAGVAARFMTP